MKIDKPVIATFGAVAVAVIAFAAYQLREDHTADAPRIQPEATAEKGDGVVAQSEAVTERVVQDAPDDSPRERRTPKATTLHELLSQRDPMSRMRGMLDFVEGMPARSIPGALKQLRERTPEWDNEGKMLAHMLLTRWAKEEPDAAFASLATLDLNKRGADAGSILGSLAAQDPARAVAWLSDPDNRLTLFPAMSQILAGTVANVWGRENPEAAMAWARTLPDSQRTGAFIAILGSMAGTNPSSAATMAMQLEAGGARTAVVGQIAEAWGKQDAQQTLAWARTLEGDDRRVAMNQAFASWSQKQPAEVANYLDTMSQQESVDDLLRTAVGTWATQAPAEAASWLSKQAEGSGKNNAMGHVMWNWTNLDPKSAANWLDRQPPGPSRDSGIGGLSLAAFPKDPASAVTWANQMSDENRRNFSVGLGLREWTKRDPAAAETWAKQNGIATAPAK